MFTRLRMSSCVLALASMPSLVSGLFSSIRHMTSCFTPPTLMVTLGWSARWRLIVRGSGSGSSKKSSGDRESGGEYWGQSGGSEWKS